MSSSKKQKTAKVLVGSFGWAVEEMKEGKIVYRFDYTNLHSILSPYPFIFLRRGRSIENASGPMLEYAGLETFKSLSHFCKCNSSTSLIVGWLPTAEDILATDWRSEQCQ